MLTVNKLIPGSRGLAPALLKRAAQLQLDWDVRQKSRFDAVDSEGRTLGVFLPRGSVVRGGDTLVAEDGSLVRVLAAPQPVLVVRHCGEHGTPLDLLRAAYHLGNRHVALALQPDHLLLEPDHVLADMLRGMHLIVSADTLPFEPESGAYAPQAAHAGHPAQAEHAAHAHHDPDHGHDHPHSQDHGHGHEAHAHPHPHPHPHPHAEPHVHGPGCDHDH